jgi:hypothetical protein
MADAPRRSTGEIVLVAARVPGAISCLLSAAHFHGLLDHAPDRVWIAIRNYRKAPRIEIPAIRTVQWRAQRWFEIGVDIQRIDGVSVNMTGASRTVLDMLRMANAVGDDLANGTLRIFVERGGDVEELRAMATELHFGSRLNAILGAIAATVASDSR